MLCQYNRKVKRFFWFLPLNLTDMTSTFGSCTGDASATDQSHHIVLAIEGRQDQATIKDHDFRRRYAQAGSVCRRSQARDRGTHLSEGARPMPHKSRIDQQWEDIIVWAIGFTIAAIACYVMF